MSERDRIIAVDCVLWRKRSAGKPRKTVWISSAALVRNTNYEYIDIRMEDSKMRVTPLTVLSKKARPVRINQPIAAALRMRIELRLRRFLHILIVKLDRLQQGHSSRLQRLCRFLVRPERQYTTYKNEGSVVVLLSVNNFLPFSSNFSKTLQVLSFCTNLNWLPTYLSSFP